MSDTDNSRDISLTDCAERWETREGYLAKLTIGWGNSTSSSTHLTADDLQQIVNAAARQYGIKPECTCPDDDWDPECPSDGTTSGVAPYCTTTRRDGYGEAWACFRRLGHKGYCGFQRTAGTGLPEDHPERGRA